MICGAPSAEAGARDDYSTKVAVDWVTDTWRMFLDTEGYPPLRLIIGRRVVESGEQPAATVAVAPFEALRALTGRRSAAQVRAYDWDADPSPWLPALTWGPFHLRPSDLDE